MRIYSFFALLIALLAVSCQQEADMQKTANGFEYIMHVSAGGEKPAPGDYVRFHAYMRNGDSTIYNTRTQGGGELPVLQIPVSEGPNRQPSPVEDLLREMGVGDSATVLINIDTLPEKPPGFENTSIVYYDLVTVSIQSNEEYMAEQSEKMQELQAEQSKLSGRLPEVEALINSTLQAYQAGTLGNDLKTTPSGLKYVIHEAGQGSTVGSGDMVAVHYYGMLTDGTRFDDSFSRGKPIEFPLGVGQVIPGWDEGIGLLKEGAKATLFIPSELGYGQAGSPPVIPPDAELVFYVERN